MKRTTKAGRVLIYVLHSGNLYGTERMALATLEGLDEYAVRVVMAPAPRGAASVAAVARQLGYAAVTFESRWQLIRGLAPWFLRHRSIDVIGVGVGANWVCHVLGRLLFVRVRQLQVAHGGTADGSAYGSKRWLNRLPVGIVAVSGFVEAKLVDHGVRADRIRVIDNFLSPRQAADYRLRPPYDPARAGARPLQKDRINVAVVSRVDAIKKIDVLIGAVEAHGLAAFHFDIYGTGDELATLRGRAAGLANVCFHGFVDDVNDRLGSADVLLHLCPAEPFGLVILEAFLTRLLVIVPDAGGAGSLVEDGVSGLRFKADDGDDLRRTLESLLDRSAVQIQQLVDNGARLLESRYSQAAGVERYRQAFASTAPRMSGQCRADVSP